MQYIIDTEEYKEFLQGQKDSRRIKELEKNAKAWVSKNGCAVKKNLTCQSCELLIAGEGFGECLAGERQYYCK